jgi:hypothetical protein
MVINTDERMTLWQRVQKYDVWLTALLCGVIAAGVWLAFATQSLVAGDGVWLMPLDDAYIHFQYARQIALGQWYVYNPGEPATSGATSWLYPYVLALGYRLGFQDLAMGAWAMGVGALALALSAFVVARLARHYHAPMVLAWLVAGTFALNGSVAWHYMSGMETGLTTLALLLLLWMVVRDRLDWPFIGAPAFLALMRPEAGWFTIVAVLVMIVRKWHTAKNYMLLCALIPLAMIAGQPVFNWAITGTWVATGNQAKSILGTVPFWPEAALARIAENMWRMIWEFAISTSAREGQYLPHLFVFALAGGVWLLIAPQRRYVALTLLLWLGGGIVAISTLDTAFWHFKRYQMPLMALLMPLAAWGVLAGWTWLSARVWARRAWGVLFVGSFVWSWLTLPVWLGHYRLNVDYVAAQPLAMARWLAANTPSGARVAVHDVGMMRYLGGRTTVDMVGLTTPNAAEYWRNGPGSVAEFLALQQPDLIAAYSDARGLGYVFNTPIYNQGQALAEFRVPALDPQYNVALGGTVQGIYRPVWDQAAALPQTPLIADATLVDMLNVADIADERAHEYQWTLSAPREGFATEVFYQPYLACDGADSADICHITDGGRLLNGGERFVLIATAGRAAWLVSRVHAAGPAQYRVLVNGTAVAQRWIPAAAGTWIDIITPIAADIIQSDRLAIEIQVTGGVYMPYRHWLYQDVTAPPPCPAGQVPLATFDDGQVQVFRTAAPRLTMVGRAININAPTCWQATDAITRDGDAKLFLHLYSDPSQPPVLQADGYLNGDQLVGHWLVGAGYVPRLGLLTESLPSGTYRLAIGLYDSQTLARWPADQASAGDGRVWLGEIVIP